MDARHFLSSSRETIARVIAVAANRIRNTTPSRYVVTRYSNVTGGYLQSSSIFGIASHRDYANGEHEEALCRAMCNSTFGRSLSGCDAAHFHRDAVGIHKTLAPPSPCFTCVSLFPYDFEIRIEK